MKMTKEDILAMTNMQKRKDFLQTWATWPVWADIPKLGMTVRVVELPDGSRITATRFGQFCGAYGYEHASLHRLDHAEGYSSRVSSESELAEFLTQLRKDCASEA